MAFLKELRMINCDDHIKNFSFRLKQENANENLHLVSNKIFYLTVVSISDLN